MECIILEILKNILELSAPKQNLVEMLEACWANPVLDKEQGIYKVLKSLKFENWFLGLKKS